jgi:hypothetical protein
MCVQVRLISELITGCKYQHSALGQLLISFAKSDLYLRKQLTNKERKEINSTIKTKIEK